MTEPQQQPIEPNRQPPINPSTLWAGGAATALVAALIMLLGLLIVRELLDTPVVPDGDGLFGSQTTSLAIYAVFAAFAATGLMHLLVLTTPRARTFFGWIMGLVTVFFALLPFAVDASWASRVGSSAIYLVTGIAITTLVASVAGAAMRRAATS